MVKNVKALFIAPLDPDFGSMIDEIILIGNDIALSIYSDELVFRVLPEPFSGVVNLDDCMRFELINFDSNIDLEWLAKASFLEVVRRFAN